MLEPIFLSEDDLTDLYTMVEAYIAAGHKLEYGDPLKILSKLETLLNEVA
jgi:hypothetical protein